MRIRIASIKGHVFRVPIPTPVRTSFGTMHDRPAMLVHVTDPDGAEGWGEVWCNFPSVGAEHRARLLRDVVAPVAVDGDFGSPTELFDAMTRHFEVLAIQAGEPGPLAQVIAGLDMAIWDMLARKAGKPIHVLLGAELTNTVRAYASGLNPERPELLATSMRERGHRAFKLKVGFDQKRDLANLKVLRETLGPDVAIMVDANQAWDVETAGKMAAQIASYNVAWLEEPIRADSPDADWLKMARTSPIPLAAGENMRASDFDRVMSSGYISVVQPDLGKWGGFSQCTRIGRGALAAGLRFCPHWLGGGVGLLASAHLLAAVGGDGLVEIDSNVNPLRDDMLDRPLGVSEGNLIIPDGPGLGATPDLGAIAPYEVLY